jgi:predicted acyl esterase
MNKYRARVLAAALIQAALNDNYNTVSIDDGAAAKMCWRHWKIKKERKKASERG